MRHGVVEPPERPNRLIVKKAQRVVRLEALQTDQSYQRGVKGKVSTIVNTFNEIALGVPLVGQRADGSLWIVDGLQRITALRRMNWTEVKCEVFASEGPEHEARMFKDVNLNRTRLKPQEEFRALLTAQDEDAWAIKNAVEAEGFGVELGRDGKSNERRSLQLTSINTLRYVYREWGTAPITFALRVIKAMWPGDPIGSHSHIIEGLARFYNRMDGAVDMERLANRLSGSVPSKVIYTAQQMTIGHGGLGGKVSSVVEQMYTKRFGRKGPCPVIEPVAPTKRVDRVPPGRPEGRD